jgi:hypothetical protein
LRSAFRCSGKRGAALGEVAPPHEYSNVGKCGGKCGANVWKCGDRNAGTTEMRGQTRNAGTDGTFTGLLGTLRVFPLTPYCDHPHRRP